MLHRQYQYLQPLAKIYTYCRSCSTPCCTQSTKKHIFVLEMCPKCFTANVFKVLHKKKKMKKYNQLTDINGLLKSTHSALSQVRKLFSLWSPSCHLSIPRSHRGISCYLLPSYFDVCIPLMRYHEILVEV